MRTTLTLDDDVVAMLARARESRKRSLKDLVNDALRQGLKQMQGPPQGKKKPCRTVGVDLGRCLVGDLDKVAEVLVVAEGENYR
jgi:hypothetical protein